MPGKIYLIQSDKSLQALSQQPYPDEDDFTDDGQLQGLFRVLEWMVGRIRAEPAALSGRFAQDQTEM